MAAFSRYIGIDYSGAETPEASLKGLRVYIADRQHLPVEIEPPPSPRKYWTRRGLADWLVDQLSQDTPDPWWALIMAFLSPCAISRSTI